MGLAGIAAIVTWFGVHQRSLGALDATKKMEAKDYVAAERIRKAGDGSGGAGSGGVRYKRDPNAVSE
jgi:hypothetical protein